jgi:hypothetical protein
VKEAQVAASTPSQVISARAPLSPRWKAISRARSSTFSGHHDAARFEDPELGDQELRDIRQLRRDPVARLDPGRRQRGRQPVRPGQARGS